MELEQEIKCILEAGLPEALVEIDRDPSTGQVGGHVVWKGFTGFNSLRRQNQIFGLLRRSISADKRKDISFIFSYTPDEYTALLVA